MMMGRGFKNESSSRHRFPCKMSSPFNIQKMLASPECK